jgi:PGF-pre-PGF domain-containing protein
MNYSGNSSVGVASFVREYNSSIPLNYSVTATLSDPYGSTTTQNINIIMYSSIIVNSYYPVNTAPTNTYVKKNNSIMFNISATELNSKPLFYYWFINNTLNYSNNNSIISNFTFNTSNFGNSTYNIRVLVSNNDTTNITNETITWNIIIDGVGPTINIQVPDSNSKNYSRIDVNYSVSDSASAGAGVDSCWYNINNTGAILGPNISISSCSNFTTYLSNGNYKLIIYSNDSVGNIKYNNVSFTINDTIIPIISSQSPSGTLAYSTTSVTLSLLTDENATCKYSTSDINYSLMSGIFSDNITTHIASYNVASGTSYTIYTRCSDMSNNSNNESSLIAFHVDSAPASSGSSGGSSGGGGGGSSGLGYMSSSDTITSSIDSMFAGITNISITSTNIPLTMLKVESYANMKNVKFTVTRTKTPQATYNFGPAFAYVIVNYDSISQDYITKTKIYFNVDKKWLSDNNISKEDMLLASYDTNASKITDQNISRYKNWTMLDITWLNEDNNKVYYSAETDSLGLFAIAMKNYTAESLESQGEGAQGEDGSESTIGNEAEYNKSKEIAESAIPRITDSENEAAQSNSGSGIGEIFKFDIDKKDYPQIISVALFSVFILVIVLGLIIRQRSIKKYEEDLLKETNQEFKNFSIPKDKMK